MKKLEAVINPEKVEAVKEALFNIGVEEMSISEVRGLCRRSGVTRVYRGAEYPIDSLPGVRIDMIVSDSQSELAADLIRNTAMTETGERGRIIILPIETAVGVRGECDKTAA